MAKVIFNKIDAEEVATPTHVELDLHHCDLTLEEWRDTSCWPARLFGGRCHWFTLPDDVDASELHEFFERNDVKALVNRIADGAERSYDNVYSLSDDANEAIQSLEEIVELDVPRLDRAL